jgi:hypothetical protein
MVRDASSINPTYWPKCFLLFFLIALSSAVEKRLETVYREGTVWWKTVI